VVDGVEVEMNVAVEVVEFDAAVTVEFRDFKVGIWRKKILK